MSKQDFYTTKDLKERGWSEEKIRRLGKPDKTTKLKNGYVLFLFSREKVNQFDRQPDKKPKLNQKQQKNNPFNEQLKIKIAELVDNRIEIATQTIITIHCGPTNSGKTYNAVQDLKASKDGCFLAPLRLLAAEIYHKLNVEGIYCSLITGEEKIEVPGAKITSSTVEMFDTNKLHSCVVLDEAHMIADEGRGWAWLRVILQGRIRRLHVITSYEGLPLLETLLKNLNKEYDIKYYKRMVPLKVADFPYDISEPINRTIYVVFSRIDVLDLKRHFEGLGKSVSVIYGNLPPEVRRKQIDRFLREETEICVATDAIGMGLNLPADRVCFVKLTKFDGKDVRELKEWEIRQIAGRAGRYGLCEYGEVGALDSYDLKTIANAIDIKDEDVEHHTKAMITPELDDLMLFGEKLLGEKLKRWANLPNAIPTYLQKIISKADLSVQTELASMFDIDTQNKLGIENLFKLIKAPVKRDKNYWTQCVKNILRQLPLPIPYDVYEIYNNDSLQQAEQLVNDCEVYFWINNCTSFGDLCCDKKEVQIIKDNLVEKLDAFLLKKRKSVTRQKPAQNNQE